MVVACPAQLPAVEHVDPAAEEQDGHVEGMDCALDLVFWPIVFWQSTPGLVFLEKNGRRWPVENKTRCGSRPGRRFVLHVKKLSTIYKQL